MNEAKDDDLGLRAALAPLPRSIEPARDLWAGIRAGIEAESKTAAAPKQFSAVSMPWAIAASVASIGIGVLITLGLQRHAAPAAPLANAPAEYSFVPASTDAVRRKLAESVAAQLANLPPETRHKVQKNLQIISASVLDIQSALARDPGNALLQDLLVTTYQNELNTLANIQAAASDAHSEVSI